MCFKTELKKQTKQEQDSTAQVVFAVVWRSERLHDDCHWSPAVEQRNTVSTLLNTFIYLTTTLIYDLFLFLLLLYFLLSISSSSSCTSSSSSLILLPLLLLPLLLLLSSCPWSPKYVWTDPASVPQHAEHPTVLIWVRHADTLFFLSSFSPASSPHPTSFFSSSPSLPVHEHTSLQLTCCSFTFMGIKLSPPSLYSPVTPECNRQ